jgi:PAS domain S-box-containing protein
MAEVVDAGIFEAWLASTDDGAVAIDAAGRVVLHNPAASRVTGLAPNDARRRPWQDVLHLPAPVAALLWDVRLSRTPTRTSADVLCAQGNLRTAEITAHPWTDASGGVGVLILLRDLTILCRRRTGPGGRPGYGNLVGADPAMEALYDLIEAVAPSDAPVVIEGEPGTGKELIAQLIHARSRRAERPLVAVDCAALAPAMLDLELFGQTRTTGHGTGAVIGRLELAHTGSLLLDRIGDMPSSAQLRVQRLLESGTIERAGDPTPRRLDVRVIATATRPLDQEVREGKLQAELVHRLQVVRIEVPPLRRRRPDIPLLAELFLARHGPSGLRLSDAALDVLQGAEWLGNVRQLENAIRHALAVRSPISDEPLGPELLPAELLSPVHPHQRPAPGVAREDRRTLLLRALSSHGGNRTAAARALGIGRATFYRWWRESGLGGEPE